jgi:hypothetical protein
LAFLALAAPLLANHGLPQVWEAYLDDIFCHYCIALLKTKLREEDKVFKLMKMVSMSW